MAAHTQRQWQGKFFRCGMRCWYCLKPLSLIPGESYEIATKDHLTPVSRGGSELIDNIVPACFACNRKKSNMTEEEFRKLIHKTFSLLMGVPSSETDLSLTARDEPRIVVLRKENESVSWAWKNPASWGGQA